MTLEDFFTLSELKDGITATARVQELVDAMTKEKEFSVKNIGDATRQWSTVASTIAATENKECLDQFIKLDGLWFIDKWLKDANAFSADTSDCFAEESISALLLALEKLQIDSESLVSSGLLVTAESLLRHKCSSIQDKARALLNSWKQSKEGERLHLISEKNGSAGVGDNVVEEEGSKLCSVVDSQHPVVNDDHQASEPSQKYAAPSDGCNDHQSKQIDSQKVELPKEETLNVTSAHADTEDKFSDVLGSPGKTEPVQNDPSIKKELTCAEEKMEVHISPELKPACDEAQAGVNMSDQSMKDIMQSNENDGPENGLSKMDISSVSSASVRTDVISKVEVEDGKESVAEPVEQTDDVNNGKSSMEDRLNEMQIDQSSKGLDNEGVLKNCTTTQASGELHSYGTKSLPESLGNDHVTEKPEDLGKTSSRMEDVGNDNRVKGQMADAYGVVKPRKVKGHMADAYGVVKPKKRGSKNPVFSETSDMDLEYGTVDALEVARQVAKEVKRQVEDYDERFDSSASEGSSRAGTGLLDNSGSASEEEEEEHSKALQNEQPAIGSSTSLAPPKAEEPAVTSENLVDELENAGQDMEKSQVTEAAQEPEINTNRNKEINTDRNLCEIDLNLEFCSEDVDHAVDSIFNPVSVVSAQRPAAASAVPTPPLLFEGSHGWKGSAATSAFRPPSPRGISDSDRVGSVGGTSSGSRQRQDSLEIDLNVAEGGENKNVDAVGGKQIQPLSSLPSGDSSVESRQAERPRFDLNLMGEEGDVQHLGLKLGAHLVGSYNDYRSPSPASSSSSMRPPFRNFDLNDGPAIIREASDRVPFLGQPSFRVDSSAGLPDDSVVSIMGARVHKGTVPNLTQSPMSFPYGRTQEVPNLAGAGISLCSSTAVPHANSGAGIGVGTGIANSGAGIALGTGIVNSGAGITLGAGGPNSGTGSPFYAYNGLPMNPGVAFSSAMYAPVPGGSIPYMIDSRGVVPQMLGSSSTMPPPYARQPQLPFAMNLVGGSVSGSNGTGSSYPNLDLNSGFAFHEGGDHSAGGFRQFLVPGLGRPMEEQLMRDNLQPSCSAAGVKRKEPEGGWDPFMMKPPPHL